MDRGDVLWPLAVLGCLLAAQAAFGQDVAAEAADEAPGRGAEIYRRWCSDCHSTETGPGTMALQRRYGGALPAILEQRPGLNADYVEFAVRRGVSFMPSFRKTEITDAELDLLVAYLAQPPQQAAVGGESR